MKVLFFNYEYPPLGGGAAHASKNLLTEYSLVDDMEVDFITSSVDNQLHIETIGNNIRVHRLPIGKNEKNLHFQSKKDLLVYSWKALFYSRKLAKKERYDLTHSFFTVPCGFISCYLKRKYNLPYIVSLRGADVPGFSERFSALYWILTPIIKIIWKNASHVVACSAGLKELARKSSSSQEIAVIYNGINIDKFHPDEARRNTEKFIVTLGGTRLTGRKGIKYLIEAVGQLLKKYPQIYLEIIGEGDEKKALEELCRISNISSNVEFLGKITNDKLPKYYQEASAFVLPSLNEGMSNAMLEALASGLPIIATPTGGADELIKDGLNGYLIKFKNSADIAEKLEKLINNRELCRKMGMESRKIAERMNWKSVAEKYFELYKEIAKL